MSRRPVLIGGAAALGVLLFWFVLLWSPQGSKISKAKQRKVQAESDQQELRVRIARLKSLQQEEPQKRAQLESLRVAIPDEPNLAQFILDANTAANVSGIQFLSISPSPPAAGTGPAVAGSTSPPTPAAGTQPAVINLQLSISGGYFQIVDFVNRVNGLSRLVVIDSLNLGGGAQAASGSSSGLNAAIAARMFVRAATPVAGAATGTPVTPGGATTTTAPGAATSTTKP